jgi:hypothetical protein
MDTTTQAATATVKPMEATARIGSKWLPRGHFFPASIASRIGKEALFGVGWTTAC